LLLLEIPGIAFRYGVQVGPNPGNGDLLGKPDLSYMMQAVNDIHSPLLQIANRIAVNRERIGVHYPTDSSASRHLASNIWSDIMANDIICPTVHTILSHAKSEWPAGWADADVQVVPAPGP
jgi:hypothetical protein